MLVLLPAKSPILIYQSVAVRECVLKKSVELFQLMFYPLQCGLPHFAFLWDLTDGVYSAYYGARQHNIPLLHSSCNYFQNVVT